MSGPALIYAAMIEVFKTDVREPAQATRLVDLLLARFPDHKINFDLSDCDHILRIEGDGFTTRAVQSLLKEQGFACSILE